jgi:hypothetical protein
VVSAADPLRFWTESENYNINLQTNKYVDVNISVKAATEQNNEAVYKSNRLKKLPGIKNKDFFVLYKGAPPLNFSPNRVTKERNDIKFFNLFHQNRWGKHMNC